MTTAVKKKRKRKLTHKHLQHKRKIARGQYTQSDPLQAQSQLDAQSTKTNTSVPQDLIHDENLLIAKATQIDKERKDFMDEIVKEGLVPKEVVEAISNLEKSAELNPMEPRIQVTDQDEINIESEYTPFDLQREFHNSTARFRTLSCGVRGGKTEAGSFEMAQTSLENNNERNLICAPTYKMLAIPKEAFLKRLEPFPELIADQNKSEGWIKLVSGTVILFRSTELIDTIRGEKFHNIWIDEGGYCKPEVENVLRTRTSDTLGRIWVTTTPRGKNWIYKWFNRGLSKQDRYRKYESFHWTSKDNPYFPQEEWDDAMAEMPQDFFDQEYRAMFLDDVAGVFRNVTNIVQHTNQNILRAFGPFVIGIDLAKIHDFTVNHVLDSRGQTVDFLRIQEMSWPAQQKEIIRMHKKWQNAIIVLDSTGVGDPMHDELVEQLGSDYVKGVKFSNQSKQQMIRALQSAIEHEEISIPNNTDLIDELKWFEYQRTQAGNIRYGAPRGFHDDCVYALALANWGRLNYLQSSSFAAMVDVIPAETEQLKRRGPVFGVSNVLNTRPDLWNKNSRMNRILGVG